jgi:molybdenum cofactor synthesis domain-containing protein
MAANGYRIVARSVTGDEVRDIAETLQTWADKGTCDLILTTGGTGFGPRDVTPEATKLVLHREAPGIPEAMRAATLLKTPMAMVSRQAAGTRGRTLVINLPGNPKAVRECLDVVLPVLPHALQVLTHDRTPDHPKA